MIQKYTRREMLKLTGRLAVAGAIGPTFARAAEIELREAHGLVAGQVKAAEIGNRILREGGNAIDAAVAAALVAGVAVPNGCGIGGYGGHMIISLAGGRKVTVIDYNSAAPAKARPDMFPVEKNGTVPSRINDYGWLAAGVPGTLAGLQLALNRYGTRSFRELVTPAIRLAEEGFPVSDGLARGIRGVGAQLRKDAGATELLFKDGEPLQPGDTYRNAQLARMLEKLAAENSVEPFYRGNIARQIADAFEQNGGLVTAQDLADYDAHEVEALELNWRGHIIRTAPLTAGGLSVLQALAILKALEWEKLPESPSRTQALIEALRVAWNDRLQLLGDPEKVKVPVERLLSEQYARDTASKVQAAVKSRTPVPFPARSAPHEGTIHLNSVDRHGNVVALTLTHGNAFGACVSVEEFGLFLGHGMSRFDPHPQHPNAPGPGKRPLHNMCPTIVFREAKPLLALGGTGGRLIPSAIFNVLVNIIGLDVPVQEAVTAPRLHTEGSLEVTLERKGEADAEALKALGYTAKIGNSAIVHAIAIDPLIGSCRSASR
jgi:gamma-glutamyltranspeptidase / glutathione hydrolase